MQQTAAEIDAAQLPESLAELVRVIGLGPCARLLERCGGRKVYVPKELRQDHPLTLIIGREAAALLIEHYQLSTIEIPKHETLVRAMRDNEIRQRHAQGASTSALAEAYWLSERHIRNICCGP